MILLGKYELMYICNYVSYTDFLSVTVFDKFSFVIFLTFSHDVLCLHLFTVQQPCYQSTLYQSAVLVCFFLMHVCWIFPSFPLSSKGFTRFVFIKMPKNAVPQSYIESSGLSPPHSDLWVLAFCIWPPFSLQPRPPEDAPSKSRMSQKLQTIRIATRFYCAIRHVRT